MNNARTCAVVLTCLTAINHSPAGQPTPSPTPKKAPVFVERQGRSNPRDMFDSNIPAYDPGWRLPPRRLEDRKIWEIGREDFSLDFAHEVMRSLEEKLPSRVPALEGDDRIAELLFPFRALFALKTVSTQKKIDAIPLVHTGPPVGFGKVQIVERDILVDRVQDVTNYDGSREPWWIHRAAIKSTILVDHKLTPTARRPETFKSLIDLLFYTSDNHHWIQIDEARLREAPKQIEYRVLGIIHRGPHSYYKSDGTLGSVPASDYTFDLRFIMLRETGEILLEPIILNSAGEHREPVKMLNLSLGTFTER